jgi:hypothetical protein
MMGRPLTRLSPGLENLGIDGRVTDEDAGLGAH